MANKHMLEHKLVNAAAKQTKMFGFILLNSFIHQVK